MAFLDFLRPTWKHSHPEIRAAALRDLGEDRQDAFLAVALEDSDSSLRILAAKRLTQEPAIRQVLKQSTDKATLEAAGKALNRLILDQAKTAQNPSPADISAWLKELQSEPKAFEELAKSAQSLTVQREAIAMIPHANALLSIAQEAKSLPIALSAVERLKRDSHLQLVAKTAVLQEVRAQAKKMLKELEEAKKPDPQTVHSAKLQILLSTVEKVALSSMEPGHGYNWNAAQEQMDQAENALAELKSEGIQSSSEKTMRFQEQLSGFRSRLARHQAKESENLLRLQALRQNQEIKAALCLQMEALFTTSEPVDSELLESLTMTFQNAGPGEDDMGLRNRFRQAKERIQKEKWRVQQEQETAERQKSAAESERILRIEGERRAEAWKSGSLEIQTLLQELEGLFEATDFRAAEKRFKEIQNRWKQLFALVPQDERGKWEEPHLKASIRFRETTDWYRWSNLLRKQEICTQLEALALTEDRKEIVVRFKEHLAEWKTIGPVPWENTEAVWDRYHKVCDELYEKGREYFAELEEERESNAKLKEDLCARLEAILAPHDFDWREATEAFKEAQSGWKAIGAAPQDRNEALWSRFRAACQSFYGRKDKQSEENLSHKMELVLAVEAQQNSTDWKNASAKIKEAQEKWKTIGPVPRDQSEGLWQRFHGACESFFKARHAHFEKLEQDRPANHQKKLALCEEIERLQELPDDEARFEMIRAAQAKWKETGPGDRDQEDVVWERFRKPIDAFFQERKQKFEAEKGDREENAKIKEDLCLEAESLRDSTDWKLVVDKIKTLQARWKTTGQAHRSMDQELWNRFRTACDGFFERLKANGKLRDQERITNLKLKEDMCFIVEILGGMPVEGEAALSREAWLSSRPENRRPTSAKTEEEWKQAFEDVKWVQGDWRKVGQVPREKMDAIWERFQGACDFFFDERRRALGLQAEDPQINLEAKLALIEEVENLSHHPSPENQKALEELGRRWKRIGPVPRAQTEYIRDRFQVAFDSAQVARV